LPDIAGHTGALSVVVAVLLTTGCGAHRGPEDTLKVATVEGRPGSFRHLALINGGMSGRANPDGTACFWVGSSDDRMALVWPRGSAAAFDPLRVVDSGGNTIAAVGDTFSATGGGAPGSVLGCTDIQWHYIK
jgi:hypothetical protein